MTFKSIGFVALLMAASFLFTSCQKDSLESDYAFSVDNALTENTLEEISTLVDEAGANGLANFKTGGTTGGNCATLTNNTDSDPHVLTIDFGSENCEGKDGKTRRGKIIVSYSGEYKSPGYTHTLTFEDFFVNDNQVLGTKIVTNRGGNESGHLFFDVVIDLEVIKADGETGMTHQGVRQREWIEGYDTEDRTDDVYLITGSGSGTLLGGKKGKGFFGKGRPHRHPMGGGNNEGNCQGERSGTMEIIHALRKQGDCRYIVSGSIKVSPDRGDRDRILDFGDGSCDDKATVTMGDKTKEITLRR